MSLAPVLSLLGSRLAAARLLRPATVAGMICAAALTGVASPAFAQSGAQEVTQLLQQGKLKEASQRVQAHLKKDSKDVQLRFLQGVVATEQKNYDQAIEVFTALTRDHPSMPEPYNNLAVLHALKGDERKAAQALEKAMGTNPSYAIAHQNLGDLYARMASDAYAKALQLDSQRQPAPVKLSIIQNLGSGPAQSAVAAPTPASVPAPTPSVAAAPAPVLVAAATPEPAPKAAEQPPVKPAAAEKPAVAPAAVAPESPAPKAQDSHAEQQVKQAVERWAKAWATQDMPTYYAAYSDHFQPSGGDTLAQWKTERKNRIVSKNTITVIVRDLKVTIQGDTATANFRQYYEAGSYKASTRKSLRMQRTNQRWQITREETGS